MVRILEHHRLDVVQKALNGIKYREIHRSLLEEGVKYSVTAIGHLMKKYKLHNSVHDRPRFGRPRVLLEKHDEFINQLISSDRQATVGTLLILFYNKFRFHICSKTLKLSALRSNWKKVLILYNSLQYKIFIALKFLKTTTRYCQVVSAENMIKRVLYAHFALLIKDSFDDCIFIDESIIELELYRLTRFLFYSIRKSLSIFSSNIFFFSSWWKIGSRYYNKYPVPKHPLKVRFF
jgi:hypothetical protein